MPLPLFIIAARDVLEDKATNLVTCVSILEVLQVPRPTAKTTGDGKRVEVKMSVLESTTIAVWKREEADSGCSFEHAFAVFADGRPEPVFQTRPVVFEFRADKPLRRFKLRMNGIPIDAEHLIEFESRVRQLGQNEWVAQRFPVIVSVSSEIDEPT